MRWSKLEARHFHDCACERATVWAGQGLAGAQPDSAAYLHVCLLQPTFDILVVVLIAQDPCGMGAAVAVFVVDGF